MQKFLGIIFIFALGFLCSMAMSDEPEEMEINEKMSCSAAKVAAGKVCNCQVVCYEDGK